MKVLLVGNGEFSSYFLYPEGIRSVEEFIEYLDRHAHSFCRLTSYAASNKCYVIEEEAETAYFNVDQFSYVKEADLEILPRETYRRRMLQAIQTKCVHCRQYESHYSPDDKDFGRCSWYLSPDGTCDSFKKRDETI